MILSGYSTAADASKDKKDYNKLGLTAAKLGRLKDAEDALSKALKIDPKYMSALVNLANVAYLRKDYKKAVDSYRAVLNVLATASRGSAGTSTQAIIMVNLARTFSAMGSDKQSTDMMAQAAKLDPATVASLAEAPPGAGGSGTRASNEASAGGTVSFLEGADQ